MRGVALPDRSPPNEPDEAAGVPRVRSRADMRALRTRIHKGQPPAADVLRQAAADCAAIVERGEPYLQRRAAETLRMILAVLNEPCPPASPDLAPRGAEPRRPLTPEEEQQRIRSPRLARRAALDNGRVRYRLIRT